jgi:hypothetical protein
VTTPVICPQCQHPVAVPESSVGQKLTCVNCQALLHIEASGAVFADWYDVASVYWLNTPDGAGLEALPSEWQRELVALMLVCREVNNGGYLQFFVNQGREAYEYASRALRVIGAGRMAEIIDRCQALIDEHILAEGELAGERAQLMPNEIIGTDGRTIKEAGSVLPEAVLDRILELSYEFMAYPDSVGDLAQSHYEPLIESGK